MDSQNEDLQKPDTLEDYLKITSIEAVTENVNLNESEFEKKLFNILDGYIPFAVSSGKVCEKAFKSPFISDEARKMVVKHLVYKLLTSNYQIRLEPK